MRLYRGVQAAALLLLCGICSCIYVSGDFSNHENFSRTLELPPVPMAAGSRLAVDSTNGSISAAGELTETCSVAATIHASAATKERAQELAEQTDVRLEPSEEGLKTKIRYPGKKDGESIGVSLDVKLPGQSSLDFETSNGNVKVTAVTGEMKIRTSNGNVDMDGVSAPCVEVRTSNGNVHLHQLASANVSVRTSNGSVQAALAPQAQPGSMIKLETSNGNINIQLPHEFSAAVDASTSNGKIKCRVPSGAYEQKDPEVFRGTLGDGNGSLVLHSSNGSIEIR